MIFRIGAYLSEMYPPVQRLVTAAALFFAPYFALQILAGLSEPTVTWTAGAGFLTTFFFLLILRISDEFKDFELDCRLFPERPLPSGRVHKTDLKILAVLSIGILFLLNSVVAPWTWGFVVLMIFGGLMLKFFFIKERIQKSLLLALITHNPVMFLLTVYTSGLMASETQTPALSWNFLQVGILCALPGLIWELSRKIKAPQDENEYETYSQIFGYRMAAGLPAALYLLHFLLTLNLSRHLSLSLGYIVALGLCACLAIGSSLRFVRSPNARTANLRPVAEIYSSIASLGFALDLMVARGIQWSL